MREFVVVKSPHGQASIQAHDLTTEECCALRGIMRDNYMSSENYVLRVPTGAFLQGYDEPHAGNDGWVLIEFWSLDVKAIEKFVAHINKKLGEL